MSKRRFLIAPDAFKGSLSANDFCAIAQEVLEARFPGCEVVALPLADGGEGTAEALVAGTGGRLIETEVTGPLGTPVDAHFGLLGDGTRAVVEMAQASGLPLVPPDRLDPLRATSYGTGQLIQAAVGAGAREVILALGGSATNDGGLGALQALGFRFLDQRGQPVPPNAEGLAAIHSVAWQEARQRLHGVRFIIASDVTNPLLGERGATAVYGPQKGADAATRAVLERNLAHFAGFTARVLGKDFSTVPGAGAAGGMGFGFLAWLGAEVRSGFEVVAEACRLAERLSGEAWELLITGEGRVDSQSVQGKLVGRLAELAQTHGVPLLVLAGAVTGGLEALHQAGVTSVHALTDHPMNLEEAMAEAPELLRRRLDELCRLWDTARICAKRNRS